MTFVETLGDSYRSRLLDFLGDMPDYEYTEDELKQRISIKKYLDDLVDAEILIKTGNKYKLNLKCPLVKSILKSDFLKAEAELDREEKR